MHDEMTINLAHYDHISEKSIYNNNYYRLKKEYGWIAGVEEIFIKCDEDYNTVRIYAVTEDDEKEFLFCDYAYSENKDDDIYSGIIGDWWT